MARFFIRRMVLGAALTVGFAASLGLADTKTMTPEQARVTAWRALHMNRPQITFQIADALAQRTPDDFEVALLKAEALRSMNAGDKAITAAIDAWHKAKTQGHKFDAAHLVAKTHFAAGHQMRAQFWLRRAEQNAPNAQARDIAVRDFQFVRRKNPLSTNIDFSVFPTSNINNGSTNEELVINGLPFRVGAAGQPHSGTGATFGISTQYQKPISERTLLRFGVKANATTYRLSSASKALGSGRRGSDFAYGAIEVQAGVTVYPGTFKAPGWGPTRFDVAVGHSWYGGNPLAYIVRISGEQDYNLSKRVIARAKLEFERQDRQDDPRASANGVSFDLDLAQSFENNARLNYGIGVNETRSQSNLVASKTIEARVAYALPAFAATGIAPTFSFGMAQTDYGRFVLGGVTRKDTKANATVSMLFSKVSYYGFAPTLSLSARQTKSSINIYSTRDFRMNVGFRSTF